MFDILLPLFIGFALAFLMRAGLRFFTKGTTHAKRKNINSQGRWLRGGLGVLLLILAWTQAWNPLLLAFAGFCFFQALFSWCGFFALIGKDQCPLEP